MPKTPPRRSTKPRKLKPDDPDILYHRGRAHLLVSKNSYAEMFKVDPHSWRVHRVLAQANAEADRHAEAIAEYEAAIKLAPTQPGLHEELGSEYRNANKIPEAEAAFRANWRSIPTMCWPGTSWARSRSSKAMAPRAKS